MYDTFAIGGARPVGLLSGFTNQRVPDIGGGNMRRQNSIRSGSQFEENQNNDVELASSQLSLRRMDNDS